MFSLPHLTSSLAGLLQLVKDLKCQIAPPSGAVVPAQTSEPPVAPGAPHVHQGSTQKRGLFGNPGYLPRPNQRIGLERLIRPGEQQRLLLLAPREHQGWGSAWQMAPLPRLSSLALIPSHTFAYRGRAVNVRLSALGRNLPASPRRRRVVGKNLLRCFADAPKVRPPSHTSVSSSSVCHLLTREAGFGQADSSPGVFVPVFFNFIFNFGQASAWTPQTADGGSVSFLLASAVVRFEQRCWKLTRVDFANGAAADGQRLLL